MMDRGCLTQTLEQMGYKASIHDTAQRMKTYRSSDKANAHIIVEKQQFGGYGDWGLECVDDKDKMHYDESDARKFQLDKLKQLYSTNVVKKTLKRNSKLSISRESQKANGDTVIQVISY